jgi:hypothetical protein
MRYVTMYERLAYGQLVAEAEKAVGAVSDPELKRIAFQKILDDLRATKAGSSLDSASKLVQVLTVVVGVIISILSFNSTRQAEAHARKAEAEVKASELEKYENQRKDEAARRQAEAAKPFLALRQELYLDAVRSAGVLANPKDHADDEVKKAKKRFRELYVAELSLAEGFGVEQGMVALAKAIDPDLTRFTPEQQAAYDLAHALRDSLTKSWGINESLVDNPSR